MFKVLPTDFHRFTRFILLFSSRFSRFSRFNNPIVFNRPLASLWTLNFELWTSSYAAYLCEVILIGSLLLFELWTLNQQLRCPLWTSLNFERATALLNFEPAVLLPYLWALCYLCEVFIIGSLLLFELWTLNCGSAVLCGHPWTLNARQRFWTSHRQLCCPLWTKLWTLNARQRIWTLNQHLRCILISLHSRLFPLFLLVFLIFHRRGGETDRFGLHMNSFRPQKLQGKQWLKS